MPGKLLVDVSPPSGRATSFEVDHGISGEDLYYLVAATTGTYDITSFALLLGTQEVCRSAAKPFADCDEGTKQFVTVLRHPRGCNDVDQEASFADIVRTNSPVAFAMLKLHSNPAALVRDLDSFGDSALSWAVYKSGRNAAAAKIAQHILQRFPAEARIHNHRTGFYALHDAAWGHAPFQLAALLCAVYPAAAFATSKHGETPDDLGRYYHRSFSWTSPAKLVEYGRALRVWAGQVAVIRRVAKTSLGLPESATTNILLLLAEPPSLEEAQQSEASPPNAGTSRTRGGDEPAIPSASPLCELGRRPRLGRPALALRSGWDGCDGGELARDCSVWAHSLGGRFAGGKFVRHRRCGFAQRLVVHVSPTGAAHHVKAHVVFAVHPELQRPTREPKWPSKMVWRRERMMARSEKRTEGC
mmetsp:Transcript_18401/g.50502  ORF Transcript_18401/g.50502 Transcript_18401/m.50502 type:complete len:415 (+) Transcript_18401:97-1341(+)